MNIIRQLASGLFFTIQKVRKPHNRCQESKRIQHWLSSKQFNLKLGKDDSKQKEKHDKCQDSRLAKVDNVCAMFDKANQLWCKQTQSKRKELIYSQLN